MVVVFSELEAQVETPKDISDCDNGEASERAVGLLQV